MVKVPMGSFVAGPNDEDPTFAMNSQSKTISVDAFWMDETEITNNEYRQFVDWVIDSLTRKTLGEQFPDEYLISEDKNKNPIDPPLINWETKIDTRDADVTYSPRVDCISRKMNVFSAGRNSIPRNWFIPIRKLIIRKQPKKTQLQAFHSEFR